MLDKRGFKPLSVLKDDPGFANLNWFSHFRLKTLPKKFSSRNNLTLRSAGVTLPSVKMGKTPLDHALLTSTGVTLPSEKTGKRPLDYALVRRSKGSLWAPATTDEFCFYKNIQTLINTNPSLKKGLESL